MTGTSAPPPLLSHAFRPFFLLAGLYAVLLVPLWLAALHGWRWPGAPAALAASWHGREMTLGFGGAVVAGFLLTAVATWTGRAPLRGAPLLVLAVAWLAGRVALVAGAALPALPRAVLDLSFPVLLAALAGREIIGGGSRRNYGIAAMAWALPLLVLLYHAGAAGLVAGGEQLAATLMVHLLALLVTVIGGRVVPSFTGNWLRQRGAARLPAARPRLDQAGIALVAAAGLADAFSPGSPVTGMLCLAAGAVNLGRLAGWRGGQTASNPLLWSLHLAWACLAAGYVLMGAAALGLPLPRAAALHLVTVGGLGGMILAMMTRVARGHTGRPLAVGPATAAAYCLVAAAAVLRSAGPALPLPYLAVVDVAGLAWVAAFAIFLATDAPMLFRSRVDERPPER